MCLSQGRQVGLSPKCDQHVQVCPSALDLFRGCATWPTETNTYQLCFSATNVVLYVQCLLDCRCHVMFEVKMTWHSEEMCISSWWRWLTTLKLEASADFPPSPLPRPSLLCFQIVEGQCYHPCCTACLLWQWGQRSLKPAILKCQVLWRGVVPN